MKRVITTGKPGYGTSKESVQLFLNLLKKNDSTKIPIHISASYSKYVYLVYYYLLLRRRMVY